MTRNALAMNRMNPVQQRICSIDYDRVPVGDISSTGSPYLDQIINSLKCEKICLIEGKRRFLEYLTYLMIIKNSLYTGKEVIFIDCMNSLDPYMIARICRNNNVDEKSILDKILISRPFTTYQLNTLIKSLIKVLERKPGMIVFSELLDLFHNNDVEEDAYIILQRVLREIKGIASVNYPLLVTHTTGNMNYLPLLEDTADFIVDINNLRKPIMRTTIESDFNIRPTNSNIFPNFSMQSILEDYGREM
jgi:hypothetical protein|tara:strand:+ start:1167 stop:1910 length:744 start_codon:yes stop_codon:yes gene_type:complete